MLTEKQEQQYLRLQHGYGRNLPSLDIVNLEREATFCCGVRLDDAGLVKDACCGSKNCFVVAATLELYKRGLVNDYWNGDAAEIARMDELKERREEVMAEAILKVAKGL